MDFFKVNRLYLTYIVNPLPANIPQKWIICFVTLKLFKYIFNLVKILNVSFERHVLTYY